MITSAHVAFCIEMFSTSFQCVGQCDMTLIHDCFFSRKNECHIPYLFDFI